MAIPPTLQRVPGIEHLQGPDSPVNVRLPLFDAPAREAVAAVAANVLPGLPALDRNREEPDSSVNVRLPLFDAPAREAVAAVAADALPRLAGSHRSRAERDAPPVFDLLADPRGRGLGVGAPSPERFVDEADRAAGVHAGNPYQGLVDDFSSPLRLPPGIGPHGTPMTVEREAEDMGHPVDQRVEAIVAPVDAHNVVERTPPRGVDGVRQNEVILEVNNGVVTEIHSVINRTVPNLYLM